MRDRPFTKLGYQIPNFTYPGVGEADLFEAVAAQAIAAEQSGFDTVFVMDHFFQLPLLGTPDQAMFEAYTLLGALAARTETARLGTLVTGVTYRNPALLAKAVTALDVISKGRALLGIGAAWFELEHESLGFRFPPPRERFEHLRDALEITKAMFTQQQSTVQGKHHSIINAFNAPRPVQAGGPPIMVGGSGEKVTFRIAAEYADELNILATPAELPQKLAALHGHLEDVGRPRDAVRTSWLGFLIIADTQAEAEAQFAEMLAHQGVDDAARIAADPELQAQVAPRVVMGDADAVAQRAKEILATGLDGIVFNITMNGHEIAPIRLAGAALREVVGN